MRNPHNEVSRVCVVSHRRRLYRFSIENRVSRDSTGYRFCYNVSPAAAKARNLLPLFRCTLATLDNGKITDAARGPLRTGPGVRSPVVGSNVVTNYPTYTRNGEVSRGAYSTTKSVYIHAYIQIARNYLCLQVTDVSTGKREPQAFR